MAGTECAAWGRRVLARRKRRRGEHEGVVGFALNQVLLKWHRCNQTVAGCGGIIALAHYGLFP